MKRRMKYFSIREIADIFQVSFVEGNDSIGVEQWLIENEYFCIGKSPFKKCPRCYNFTLTLHNENVCKRCEMILLGKKRDAAIGLL